MPPSNQSLDGWWFWSVKYHLVCGWYDDSGLLRKGINWFGIKGWWSCYRQTIRYFPLKIQDVVCQGMLYMKKGSSKKNRFTVSLHRNFPIYKKMNQSRSLRKKLFFFPKKKTIFTDHLNISVHIFTLLFIVLCIIGWLISNRYEMERTDHYLP